jgi:hypothetical protein
VAGCSIVEASGAGGAPQPATPIDHVVMYAVDEDSDELLRYAFGDDDYFVVGQILDQDGNVLHEVEALGYILTGPHKGLYGVSNYDGNQRSRLIKFNTFTATATVYPVDIGYGNIEGMVGVRDPDTGAWSLYAVQAGDSDPSTDRVTLCHFPPGNPDNAHTITVGLPALPAHLAHGDTVGPCPDEPEVESHKNLIMIDPATGEGTFLAALGARFEGLALGPDGGLYAARGNELWAIDPFNCPVVRPIGTHGYQGVGALEYASGDGGPRIDVPGVPAGWTAEGVLFAFSDDEDVMLILNAANGGAVEYAVPVGATDLEGLVFLTESKDSFGEVVVGPCD